MRNNTFFFYLLLAIVIKLYSYIMYVKEMSPELEASIKEFFDLFDSNGDGKLTAAELLSVLECNGEVTTIEEVERFVSNFWIFIGRNNF